MKPGCVEQKLTSEDQKVENAQTTMNITLNITGIEIWFTINIVSDIPCIVL